MNEIVLFFIFKAFDLSIFLNDLQREHDLTK